LKISTATTPRRDHPKHCFINGEDITDRCYEADDEAGYALCYVIEERYENGSVRFKPDPDNPTEPLSERLTGEVRFEF